ncbi:hypothetical protein [Enterovirga rhinocerotis]|uniref:Uncharacterized protein n=1 Tax=Enterovirga rhinocerotis TaxID=1339210 RepID=A0A4R7C0J8_9HYPH|nr:hypothetical protein [Enterovirga rhinocerotis]TDR91461.1 hypothetical protein EV668_2361 [Enterovirga rhinocerotis]
MSLLLQRLVTLVLFIIVMAGWAWVLNRTVPGIGDWLDATISPVGTAILIVGIIVGGWPLAYWLERRHRDKRGIQSGARGP